MARLDPLIAALFAHDGRELFFRTGSGITLSVGDRSREVMLKPLNGPQIESVLREIMPPTLALPGAEGGSLSFHYRAPAGPVQVSYERHGNQARVRITPAHASAEDAPAESPEAVPARIAGYTLDELLSFAHQQHASAIHLVPGRPPLLRVEGDLVELSTHPPVVAAFVEEELLSRAPSPSLAEATGRFEFSGPEDIAVQVLVIGALPRRHAIIRLLPHQLPALDSLGLPPEALEIFRKTSGLVLVSGPTGAGRTSTLLAAAEAIAAARTAHVFFADDTVALEERSRLSVVTTCRVGSDVSDWAAAAALATEIDADVAIFGAFEEPATVDAALRLVAAGKLVLAAVDAVDATQAVADLVLSRPVDHRERVRGALSRVFGGAVSQVLVRRRRGGRIAAAEVLASTPAIRSAIADGRFADLPRLQGRDGEGGSLLLEEALASHVRAKAVDEEEALRWVRVPSDFFGALGRYANAQSSEQRERTPSPHTPPRSPAPSTPAPEALRGVGEPTPAPAPAPKETPSGAAPSAGEATPEVPVIAAPGERMPASQ